MPDITRLLPEGDLFPDLCWDLSRSIWKTSKKNIGNSNFSRGRKKRNNARKSALFRQEKAAAELFYDLQFGTTPEVTTQLTLWPIFMKGILNLVLSL